jgi:hypothetical protein
MELIGDAARRYVSDDVVTEGDFVDEPEAVECFRNAIAKTGCFTVYTEVECWYFGNSPFSYPDTGRIDFLLTPTQKLIAAGWEAGIVGVEVKKSGHKAGPLVTQMKDYRNAVYRIKNGILVVPSIVCCFPPLTSVKGSLQSIMANNALGCARVKNHDTSFLVDSTNVFACDIGGNVTVKPLKSGYKNGSR